MNSSSVRSLRTNHLPKLGNRIWFYWILSFCFVLSGCQSASQEETVPPVTFLPTTTQAVPLVETPQSINTDDIPTTAAVLTQESVTSVPDTELATPSVEQTLTALPLTFVTDNGFLLSGAMNNGEEQIYALQPGDISHFVTKGSILIGQALSPDGTKMVFDTNNRSEATRSPDKVFIFDLESEEILPLNLLAYPRSGVFWSKDASSLLYIARYGVEALEQLVVYDVLTGENQILTEMEEIVLTSGWSIDNETVAFVAKVDGQHDLFTVNSKTLAQEQLTDNPDIETLVLWSPTAPQLLVGTILDERSAFESWPWGVESLYVFTPSNNEWHLLLEKTLGSESVSWAPDGKQIAFSDAGLLCIKNLETMAENCPLEDVEPYNEYFAAFLEPPVWSDDIKWLAFRAFDGRCDLVYFLELETNLITSGDFGCGSFSSLGPIYWSSAQLPEFSD